MNFSIPTKEFRNVINLLKGVSGKEGYIELSEWFASAVGVGVKLALQFGNGLEKNKGSSIVMAAPLIALCDGEKLKEETVEFIIDKENLVVKSGRSRTKLKCHDASVMGWVGLPDDALSFSMRKAGFELLLDRVRYAVGNDETRPMLNGVHMHTDAGKIVSVGLNGHRLARYAVNVPDVPAFSLTIGNDALRQVRKFLDYAKPDRDMTFSVSEGKAQVSTEYGSVAFTLLDGQYPEYQRLIPEITDAVEVDCEKMKQSLNRLVYVAGPEKKITAEFASDKLKLEAFDVAAVAGGEEELDFSGENKIEKCAFNGQYMSEAISKCECVIEFNADKPIVGCGMLDREYRFVIMPMRI